MLDDRVTRIDARRPLRTSTRTAHRRTRRQLRGCRSRDRARRIRLAPRPAATGVPDRCSGEAATLASHAAYRPTTTTTVAWRGMPASVPAASRGGYALPAPPRPLRHAAAAGNGSRRARPRRLGVIAASRTRTQSGTPFHAHRHAPVSAAGAGGRERMPARTAAGARGNVGVIAARSARAAGVNARPPVSSARRRMSNSVLGLQRGRASIGSGDRQDRENRGVASPGLFEDVGRTRSGSCCRRHRTARRPPGAAARRRPGARGPALAARCTAPRTAPWPRRAPRFEPRIRGGGVTGQRAARSRTFSSNSTTAARSRGFNVPIRLIAARAAPGRGGRHAAAGVDHQHEIERRRVETKNATCCRFPSSKTLKSSLRQVGHEVPP